MTTSDPTPAIRLERQFAHPAERVYAAWTDPRDVERWAWGSLGDQVRAEIDCRVGGKFHISTARPEGPRWAMAGAFTEVVPLRRLAHSLAWDAPMGYPPVAETIAVEFVESEAGTLVIFVHQGDFGRAARDGHVRGWGNVLDLLERHLEA